MSRLSWRVIDTVVELLVARRTLGIAVIMRLDVEGDARYGNGRATGYRG